jgi:hypothetical protein
VNQAPDVEGHQTQEPGNEQDDPDREKHDAPFRRG